MQLARRVMTAVALATAATTVSATPVYADTYEY